MKLRSQNCRDKSGVAFFTDSRDGMEKENMEDGEWGDETVRYELESETNGDLKNGRKWGEWKYEK